MEYKGFKEHVEYKGFRGPREKLERKAQSVYRG
jgi:hypothetical protein